MEVGLNHEQQHQELMQTDILHAFAQNPITPPTMRPGPPDSTWTGANAGEELGDPHRGYPHRRPSDDSFHFDNEKPAHRALVGPVKIARNLITNAEWLAFMQDGGYTTPTLWLMDGFATVEKEEWRAPGHWRRSTGNGKS